MIVKENLLAGLNMSNPAMQSKRLVSKFFFPIAF